MQEYDELSLSENKPSSSGDTGSPAYKDIIRTDIFRTILEEVNKKDYISFLTSLSHGLVFDMHSFTSQGDQMCRKSKLIGEETCKWCEEPAFYNNPDKTKKNFASPCIGLLIYNHSAVGRNKPWLDRKTKEPKKDKDGKVIMLEGRPVQVLVLKRGIDNGNLQQLEEYDAEEVLTSAVFSILKHPKEAKKTVVPATEDRTVAEKIFKRKLNVPADVQERFEAMTKEEARGLIANVFGVYNEQATDKLLQLTIKPEPVESNKENDPDRVSVG